MIDTILTSYTEVIANPASYADPDKRKAMDQLMTLLNGALDARGKVLLKVNVSAEHRDAVLAVLPSPSRRRSPSSPTATTRSRASSKARDQPRHPGAAPRPAPPTCSRSRSARSSSERR